MTSVQPNTSPQHRPPFWKRRFYVHALQKKYAIYLAAYLFSYSVLVFGLALLVPHLVPILKLYLPLPIEERAIAASQFLTLAESLGPTIVALIFGSAFFSFYLTHKVAGPLYRLEKHAAALAKGDLSGRIKLRAGDELQQLAELLNRAIERLDNALTELNDREASRYATVEKLLREMKADPASGREAIQQLEMVLKDGEQVRALLRTFQISGRS